MTRADVCAVCGRPLPEHDLDLRFRLPQPVLEALPDEQERAGRTWGDDVLMQVQGVGAFVRILVPVSLTGGFSVVFGAWLGVHPDDLQHAWYVWNKPEYMQLTLRGVLANLLPPWEGETYRKPVEAAPRVAHELPYATTSSDPALQNILTREWDHEPVLDAMRRCGAASS